MLRSQSTGRRPTCLSKFMPVLIILGWLSQSWGEWAEAAERREQLIPILGVTLEQHRPVGTVVDLVLSFEERPDRAGLRVIFQNYPGRFSPMAQTAVKQAILRAAHAAGLSTDSWSVMLGVPYPGLTIYGNSLSAMVALSVLALARGDLVPIDRVITGAITPDGRIAPVGSVPLKIAAAKEAQMRRILVPEEADPGDGDWQTPFLGHVSPVGSVGQAYLALTDHSLSER